MACTQAFECFQPTCFMDPLCDARPKQTAACKAGKCVLVTEPDSRVVRCNPACRELSGYPGGGLRDCRLLDHTVTEAGRERWLASLAAAGMPDG